MHELIVKRSHDDARCIDYFDSLEVNGHTLVKGTDYTVESGSTVLKIKSSYLQTLADGKHDLSIRFVDGRVDTKLTVLAARKGVKTGDDNTPGVWFALLALSGFGVFAAVETLRPRKRYVGKHCA